MGRRLILAALALGMLLGAANAEADGARVLQVERALYALGYHGENCDEQMDAETVAALKNFQTANGLEVTGEPDDPTTALLESGGGVTCHEYLTGLVQEYTGAPILQTGSSGGEVQRLQERLKELGYYHSTCDGVFGEETAISIRCFQMVHGLTQTGMADQSTQLRLWEGAAVQWADFLVKACAVSGDSGSNVRLLQRTLRAMGYFSGECSGDYGDMTQQAVMAFQRSNGLEESGEADSATCERLFSGQAAARREQGTVFMGNSGEVVARIQRRLSDLGYYRRTVAGSYGCTTATAVRLFQMANGLSCTGEADALTQERLASEDCVTLENAREDLSDRISELKDAADVIGSMALRVRGRSFDISDGEEQEGFSFVQYVCVAAGIPVIAPEDLTARITETVEDPQTLIAGDVVMLKLERADGAHELLAIASGDGRVVYATSGDPWVLESDLSMMNAAEIRRWSMETVGQ